MWSQHATTSEPSMTAAVAGQVSTRPVGGSVVEEFLILHTEWSELRLFVIIVTHA